MPETKPPFIVLKSVNDVSVFHTISLAEGKPVTFGRGRDVDVRIPDVAISRVHAMIRFKDGQFFLEDNKSKFGTGVQATSLTLEAGHEVTIQSGRSIFDLQFVP